MFLFLFLFLFSSNLLIQPVMCESSKYNGLITSLSLYPIKYLNELYLPYFSFLETNILLTSTSFILNIFLFLLQKSPFYIFCRRSLCYFHSFLYPVKKKRFFYNNWGIHTLIVYFCFMLIDLINDYKKS